MDPSDGSQPSDGYYSLRAPGYLSLMRDHNDRMTAFMKRLEHGHDLSAGGGVQVAGGFVCEEQDVISTGFG